MDHMLSTNMIHRKASTYRFSIIIPVYNVSSYLPETLNSLYRQQREDTELILVDDGSTDGSGELCTQYARTNNRTQVIHQANGGVAAAREAGLAVAGGEYLLWVDPDDIVRDCWLERIDERLRLTQCDMLLFDYEERREDATRSVHYGRKAGRLEQTLFLKDLVRDIRMGSYLWNKVTRRSLWDGLHFDCSLRCMEDYDIVHKLALRAKNIQYLPEVLYVYLIRSTGLVKLPDLNIKFQNYQVAKRRLAYLEGINQTCDPIGLVMQAKGFVREYYLAGEPPSQQESCVICRETIRAYMPKIWMDRELSLKRKLTTLFILSPWLCRVLIPKSRTENQAHSRDG